MKNKIYTYSLFIIPFIVIFTLSKVLLNDYYLFEWTARHYYLYIWVIGLILIILRKDSYGVALSLSNILGIVIGQFLGDFLREKRMSYITTQTDNQTIYELSRHHGVIIWLVVIAVCMLIFVLFNLIKKKTSVKIR